MNCIRNRILAWARRREPDFLIGGAENPYLRRWRLLPRNRFFNVYVHQFLRSDDDRALHDHPWMFNASWMLDGWYVEHTIRAGGVAERAEMASGDFKFRWGPAPHRVELLTVADFFKSQPNNQRPVPCWTLFITGPVVRTWGFHCPRRWIPWREFVDARDAGLVGKGCSE